MPGPLQVRASCCPLGGGGCPPPKETSELKVSCSTIPAPRSGPVRSILLIALLCCALVITALAQEQNVPPRAARGRAVAMRWCAPCHLVQLRLTTIDPPTFTSIADDPSKTPDYLRTF